MVRSIGLLWLLLLAAFVCAVGTAWWWSGTPQSLGTALRLASRYMPEGQSLKARDVEGALRGGGRIAWLRWQGRTLAVEATEVEIAWRLMPLLDRRLQVDSLRTAQVTITPILPAEPPPPEPLQPLKGITLPLDVDLSFAARHIRWAGDPAVDVHALEGRYRYDAGHHLLDLAGVEVADGRYQGTVKLQGAAPMALQAALTGRVQAPVPQGVAPLAVLAKARVDGTLAGAAARLGITAHLAPEPAAGSRSTMQADLDAELAPWAPQPVVRARADFQDIDAARLWPTAPRTLLTGRLDAGPAAAAPTNPAPTTPAEAATVWQAQLTARNADSGPWDSGKLPVTAIDASARRVGERWEIPEAAVQVGSGRLRADGSWSPAPAPWRIDATLDKLQPSLLHTRLDATPVSGKAKVEQRGPALLFDVGLQAEAAPRSRTAPMAALRIDQAIAKGQWVGEGQTLRLDTLRIDAGTARLNGQGTVQVAAQSADAALDLVLPGANAKLQGKIAPRTGDLQADLHLQDAAELQRWVEGLPGLDGVFAGARADGSAQLAAQLEGGWQTLQAQATNPSVPAEGLRLQATLRAPRLAVQLPAQDAVATTGNVAAVNADGTKPPAPRRLHLEDVRAELAGTPAEARLSLDGNATIDARRITLSTRATAGLAPIAQWRIAFDSLRVAVADTAAANTAPWQLQLDAPLRVTARQATSTQALPNGAQLEVEATAGKASLSGPVPGTAQLAWQPLQFASVAAPAASGGRSFRLRTQGTLTGLPMAWADALGADLSALNDSGVRGDLVFDGEWDIEAGERLRAHAKVARRSGDIQVLVGGTTLVRRIRTEGTGTASETEYDNGQPLDAKPTPAGVRQAVLQLDAQDEAVRAQLTWDSERAGQVQADLRTTAQQADGAWAWPENAPLSGVVKATLPSIGAWSFLAPPAWRIEGSMAADATISGNRKAPLWNGTLRADGLAVKIPVEGVDLRDGRLRATLDGNRLRIDDFLLRGGAASRARISGPSGNLSTVSSEAARDGGLVSVRGDMQWGEASPTASAIRMALVAELRSLRVLVRSDRQISTSGQLQATLDDGQLRLRGKLTVNRGVVILPEETAPSLGSDVQVHSAAKDREAAAKAARLQKTQQASAARAESPKALKPPDIAVTLNMGNDFAVQGLGITTRLGGEIEVTANAATRSEPRITGEIRTVQGRYRAYGQELDVETGILRFNGAYANPSLDILALRPNISQRAGVRILGTADSPQLQLYSSPQLADAETLSWIVLGRSAAGGGADAAVMQQAALALLSGLGPKGGGNLASRFGLDEIGFKGKSTEDDVKSSAITVGKRISANLYVTYEHSLAGALGTFYVFYDLTQRLALRGQAGRRSAVDLIYTVSYD